MCIHVRKLARAQRSTFGTNFGTNGILFAHGDNAILVPIPIALTPIAVTLASIGRGPFANGVLTPSGMERPRVPPPGGPSESPRRAPGGQYAKIFTKKGFS